MLPASCPGFPHSHALVEGAGRLPGAQLLMETPALKRAQGGSLAVPSPTLALDDTGTSSSTGARPAVPGMSGMPRPGERILT